MRKKSCFLTVVDLAYLVLPFLESDDLFLGVCFHRRTCFLAFLGHLLLSQNPGSTYDRRDLGRVMEARCCVGSSGLRSGYGYGYSMVGTRWWPGARRCIRARARTRIPVQPRATLSRNLSCASCYVVAATAELPPWWWCVVGKVGVLVDEEVCVKCEVRII